jgi:site-specific DNA-methyltransferase (adenine-specific)
MSEGKKEILLGDCLELMNDIPNGNIDMILADLPYGTTACKWDTIIPFDKLWEQYERIIKPNGAIVLTASQPFTTELINSKRTLFRYEMIWAKNMPTGAFNANKMPMKSHENVLVFYKSLPTYNPQKTKRTEKELKRFMKEPIVTKIENSVYGSFDRTVLGRDAEMKNPNSLLLFDVVNGRSGDKQPHPTQKPVALFEYLIKTYTNEGDIVLDNCAGSGTTAIACLKTNRQFIVMEKEQKYYDIILKRVADFNKNFETQTLFGNEM